MRMAFVLFDGMTSMDLAGFYEAVDLDGDPESERKRIMDVLCRQGGSDG